MSMVHGRRNLALSLRLVLEREDPKIYSTALNPSSRLALENNQFVKMRIAST